MTEPKQKKSFSVAPQLQRFAIGVVVGSLLASGVQANPSQEAFEELSLVRCLPAVATGNAVNTTGLKKLSKSAAQQFFPRSNQPVYSPDAPFVLLQTPTTHSCTILFFQASPRAIKEWVDDWFASGDAPFEEVRSKGRVSADLTREFLAIMNGRDVRILLSTSRKRSLAVLSIFGV